MEVGWFQGKPPLAVKVQRDSLKVQSNFVTAHVLRVVRPAILGSPWLLDGPIEEPAPGETEAGV